MLPHLPLMNPVFSAEGVPLKGERLRFLLVIRESFASHSRLEPADDSQMSRKSLVNNLQMVKRKGPRHAHLLHQGKTRSGGIKVLKDKGR